MSFSKESLLSCQEAADLLRKESSSSTPENIKFIDGTYALPGHTQPPCELYHKRHIPGACYFDIDAAADPDSPLAHTVPPAKIFAEYTADLNIGPQDHVIIYGQKNLAMGPCRVAWMFDYFGHKKISLLNASLDFWEKEGYPLAGQLEKTKSAENTHNTNNTKTPAKVMPAKVMYAEKDIRIHPELLATMEDVRHALPPSEKTVIIDARPESRFCGSQEEPRSNLQAGHMPGALNLPASELLNPSTGGLAEPAEVQRRLDALHLTDQSVIITTCGSGVTACVLYIAAKICGYSQIQVYDGSWSEWGLREYGLPVEKCA